MQLTVANVPIFLFQYSYYLKKMDDIMPYIKASQAAESRDIMAMTNLITEYVAERLEQYVGIINM